VFVGPQPPRGWELNEELLHANTSIPPTHQYLAFYFWLRNEFRADAIVHLGRHSTYEFLPRKGVGQDEFDYPALIAGDIPGVYPYIVDGVGEGLQAKRRGLAVMVDHLIPPLTTTPLYDDLLRLRQLVESYESSNNPALRQQAAASMRTVIDELHLKEALTASMDAELKVRGIAFEQADDELLVHEIGHYLTHLQEDFMPLGLHVFGKPWTADALQTMLVSMQVDAGNNGLRQKLESSPANEMRALLHGLSGRFIPAGPGNDPIRNPEALPTGRNFHGLDNSLIPSRLGYSLGSKLAGEARAKVKEDGKEAVILWASDSVRDEGAMVGFGLSLLGIVPQWNSRGIVAGLERQPLSEVGVRADTVFVASGLFRDLFGQQIVWLDKAVLLALDGSRTTIERSRPDLAPALRAALEPLGAMAKAGDEPLTRNHVARHWINETSALIKQGMSHAEAGKQASLRVFGTAPGDYSAGINRAIERSGSWTDRKELAQIYIDRIGHAYSADGTSQARQDLLRSNLREVRNTYLGRSSNLYGLMDNNDAFDYLGGLSLAVETLSGRVPASHVADDSNPSAPQMQPLPTALLTELRGRYLNPAWIKPLMQHGYAGARTMGSEFMEYLWGWQVTNPDVIKSWAWDEVKQVYIDDRQGLGLDKFLEQDSNVHVKTNMMAIMLVAAEKKFWQADEATLRQVGQKWVDLLLEHGLPGSGHTRPDHPVFQWVQPYLRADQIEPLKQMLERARVEAKTPSSPTAMTELQAADKNNESQQGAQSQGATGGRSPWGFIMIVMAVAMLLSAGYLRGRYVTPKGRSA
jgi:cobaltochelatase CobN